MTRSTITNLFSQSIALIKGTENENIQRNELKNYALNALSAKAQACLKGGDGEEDFIVEDIIGD